MRSALHKLYILLFILISVNAKGIVVTGHVVDEKNQPLPFVSVFIAGTSIGTTANVEGEYRLDLNQGTHELTYKMIGYTAKVEKVVVQNSTVTLNIQLNQETVNLKAVVIRADAEDPAYEVIRNAQNKRKFYRDQIKEFACDAYVKSTQRLTDHPKSFMGEKIDANEFMDTTTKMFYLSESVSHLFYKQPNDFKEEMISSKVSGSARTYSFNQSADVLINLYDNIVNLSGITPRGIISPISANAFFSYKYRLEGTFIENGKTINKISVIPKRRSDPVFTGTIYIADDDWYINSADLFITKDQQMEFIDTFRMRETFMTIDGDKILPFNHQLSYSFSFVGFKGDGVVIGVFNNYLLNGAKPEGFAKGEIMKVNAGSNKKDSLYWETVRPIPLTNDEAVDYHRRDSAQVIKESKPYLDSLDRVNNKFTAGALLKGYYWDNSFKKRSYGITSPLLETGFNTVEGWNSRIDGNFYQSYGEDEAKEFSVNSTLRYGFSNTHWNANTLITYRYSKIKNASVTLDAGTDVQQFNPAEPISPLINSIYTLFGEKNFMKLYERRYADLTYRSEITNGLDWKWNIEYSQRERLSNTSDYKVRDIEGREYTLNVPDVLTGTTGFPVHEAFVVELETRIRIGQKYISRPDSKYNLGTKFPTFRIAYRKAFDFAGGDVKYDMVRLQIDDQVSVGMLGRLFYKAVYRKMFDVDRAFVADYLHFNGNKTALSNFNLDEFKNLPYYTFSTNNYGMEIHAEQNFGGFFLNKIPLIRKIKLKEIIGFHYLKTDLLNNYMEFSAGVEKIGLLRFEVYTSLNDGKRGNFGIMVGSKLNISR
ncbi:MAG: carboxypeptidase-like regulatory domain-containing protein [Bacteroidetes bacterium]|nr:carboxypeptidase-like regulatory domain-containing protein [Bacteroidota bacterium]MBP6428651.1 carboxypeptidase-like regulatory domain-containing protein [Bacteroidia bacterium]MBP6656877.1 carboxypeptidase-like regulatory domain-containing protein [Bacteroidia bacterium]